MSESQEPAKLFVIILDQPQLVDEILTGFLDIGVKGGTVIESRGMGQIIRDDMPIFAGLADLFGESTGNRMIMSVMPQSMLNPVFDLVEEVVGQLDAPNSAVCFTLPVEQFRGFRH